MKTTFLLFVIIIHHVEALETEVWQIPGGGGTRICQKRTDDNPCEPDTEIRICRENYGMLQCVPCAYGLRNCDRTTSALPNGCYDPTTFCSLNGDNLVIVTNLTTGGCQIRCQCNEEEGYTGSSPHQCDDNGYPCQQTHTRSIVGGVCYPCRDGYYNPWDDGVNECIKKPRTDTPVSGDPPPDKERVTAALSKQLSSTTSTPSSVIESSGISYQNYPWEEPLNNINSLDEMVDTMNKMKEESTTTNIGLGVIIGVPSGIVFGAVAMLAVILWCRRNRTKDTETDPEVTVPMTQTETPPSGRDGTEHAESEETLVMSITEGPETTSLLHTGNPYPGQADVSPQCISYNRGSQEEVPFLNHHDDQLYKMVKQPFCTSVNPKQLLLYLNLTSHDDERIGEIQVTDGREAACHQLLLKLVQHYPHWVSDVCRALRHYDVQLGHIADEIERSLETIAGEGACAQAYQPESTVSQTYQAESAVNQTLEPESTVSKAYQPESVVSGTHQREITLSQTHQPEAMVNPAGTSDSSQYLDVHQNQQTGVKEVH